LISPIPNKLPEKARLRPCRHRGFAPLMAPFDLRGLANRRRQACSGDENRSRPLAAPIETLLVSVDRLPQPEALARSAEW
jgi:hypothetical protein